VPYWAELCAHEEFVQLSWWKGKENREMKTNSRNNTHIPLNVAGFMSLLFAWSCGAPINVPALTPEEIPAIEAAGNYPHRRYIIEPEDTLQIRYTFHPEMNQEVMVRPDGKVTATVVGEVVVSGMTTVQLEKLLVARTSDVLRNPEVVVSISKYAERNVYIGGEVRKPGVVRYRHGLTPLQAIIAAGGFDDGAQPDSVILVRRNGLEDTFLSRKLDLTEKIVQGDNVPLFLAPNDVVYVPRSSIAEANLWVRQHITDLFPFLRGSAAVTYRPGQ
jgi:protein involved in polysaccharide export with SLBB domain